MDNLNPNAAELEIITAIAYTLVAFVLMTVAVLVFVYFSRKKILNQEVEKRDLELVYQKKLLQSTILTQEAERSRIARELHDDISSGLNVVSLNAHLLTVGNLSKTEFEKLSADIIKYTTAVLENSRRIAHDLLPPILDNFGLDAAIRELCHAQSAGMLQVIYDNPYEDAAFGATEKKNHLHIFRILQELTSNSFRHGKASLINIKVDRQLECCSIYYTDNGIGFSKGEALLNSGIGMKNIESRAMFLGGSFEIKSSKGQGVQAKLVF